jgi:hypothetical protein
MQKLPLLSELGVVKIFQNLGWQVARQKKAILLHYLSLIIARLLKER